MWKSFTQLDTRNKVQDMIMQSFTPVTHNGTARNC